LCNENHFWPSRDVSLPARRIKAPGASLFLYRDVLGQEIGGLNAVPARRLVRASLVLPAPEVRSLLTAIDHLIGAHSKNAGVRTRLFKKF
jgi:hypothetical protein